MLNYLKLAQAAFARVKLWLTGLWKSLFPHEKAVRYILTGFVIALIAALATECRASEAVLFEGGAQYMRGPAAAMAVHVQTDGPNDASIEYGLVLIGGSPYNDGGVMGVEGLIVDGFGRLDLGLGVAYFNREHSQLGSQMNFTLLVRYNITDRWYVAVRHWSNAGTTKENTGIDAITLGRRF